MTDTTPTPEDSVVAPAEGTEPVVRKRPKPGERRVQILQTLAAMLEQPGAERITTAALAGRLEVSEAALYRHFASKAQMFEGLIEFIEQSVFSLVNQITRTRRLGRGRPARSSRVVLQFSREEPRHDPRDGGRRAGVRERAPAARMNQFFDRIESQLRQSLRGAAESNGSSTPTVDANAQASVLTGFVVGRLQRYARSGFKRSPVEHLDAALDLLVAG